MFKFLIILSSPINNRYRRQNNRLIHSIDRSIIIVTYYNETFHQQEQRLTSTTKVCGFRFFSIVQISLSESRIRLLQTLLLTYYCTVDVSYKKEASLISFFEFLFGPVLSNVVNKKFYYRAYGIIFIVTL